jgi:hypothetical protein
MGAHHACMSDFTYHSLGWNPVSSGRVEVTRLEISLDCARSIDLAS